MIKSYTLKALQKAINHGLALDVSSAGRIKKLAGKRLKIVVKPINVVFFIQFSETSLELHQELSGDVDTVIESNPMGFIRLSLLPSSKVRSLFNDQIKLTGNIEVGQQVKELFDDLDIDWEGHLSQFTGDVVAHQVGRLFRKGHQMTNQLSESFHHSMTEFIQEEIKMFPPTEEVQDFFKDVDELLLGVERLEAKINQLMIRHENN